MLLLGALIPEVVGNGGTNGALYTGTMAPRSTLKCETGPGGFKGTEAGVNRSLGLRPAIGPRSMEECADENLGGELTAVGPCRIALGGLDKLHKSLDELDTGRFLKKRFSELAWPTSSRGANLTCRGSDDRVRRCKAACAFARSLLCSRKRDTNAEDVNSSVGMSGDELGTTPVPTRGTLATRDAE